MEVMSVSEVNAAVIKDAATGSREEQVLKLRESTRDLFDHCFRVNQEPQWKTLFKFINETSCLRPETFLQGQSSDDTGILHQQQALFLWVVGCLLRVLAIPDSSTVFCGAQECLLNLMKVAESGNHYLLCFCLREVTDLSSALAQLQRQHRRGALRFPVSLSHFQHNWNQQNAESEGDVKGSDLTCLIDLPSLSHVQSLLQGTLELLTKYADDLLQFCSLAVPRLLEVLCNSMKCGTAGVKQTSLRVLTVLLEKEVTIMQPVLDHILWCILALLGFLCDHSNVAVGLEMSLAACLKTLFLQEHGFARVVHRFWKPMLDALTEYVVRGGYSHSCEELQECVGEILLKCSRLKLVRSYIIGERLLFSIGCSVRLQPLVGCYCYLLQDDIKEAKVAAIANTDHLPLVERIDEEKRGRHEKLTRIPSKTSKRFGIDQLSPLSSLLLHKMIACQQFIIKLCHSDHPPIKVTQQLLLSLEGVRFCYEVCARLCVTGDYTIGDWLLRTQLNNVCRAWESAVYQVCDSCDDTLCNVLSVVLKSVGALFLLFRFCSNTSTALERCFWFLELPWNLMGDQIANSGLSTAQHDIMRSVHKLSDTELTMIKVCSLLACAVMLPSGPADVRKLCLLKTALEDCNETVLHTLLTSFAGMLATTDRCEVSVLLGLLREKVINSKLQMLLAQQLVPIALASCASPPPCMYSLKNTFIPLHYTSVVVLPPIKERSGLYRRISSAVFSSIFEVVTDHKSIEIVPAMLQSFSILVDLIDDASIIYQKCLPLLLHNNSLVLNSVRKYIQLFFKRDDSTEESAHPVIPHLVEAFKTGIKKGNTSLQEFAVTTVGEIGRFTTGVRLVPCVVALLTFTLQPSMNIRALAHVQIQRIAKAHRVSVSKLLSLYKEPICNFIVLNVLNEHQQHATNTAQKHSILQEVSSFFGKKCLKPFFEVVKDALIPAIVCRATTQAAEALEIIANSCDVTVRTSLIDNFKFIFLHLVTKGQQEDLHIVSEFLKVAGGFDMTALLHSEARSVLNLLLLHLSTHKVRVLAGIKIVAGIKKTVNIESEEHVADYLHPRLHGIIAYFNFVLLRVNCTENSAKGKLVINSLMELMKLMGPKYVTLVKMKVIGMLRYCLSFREEELTVCSLLAWECFIKNVEVESLGPLLGQVVVALSPLVNAYPQQVASIFNFLIIESRDVLLLYFSEIYLMPDHASLKNINAVLQASNQGDRSLQEKFCHVLKGVRHERSDVRRDALKALHTLQKENRNELQRCMVGSDTTDPVITEIISTLFTSLRGAEIELRELYGKCLGELGAIDPGKLDIPTVSPVKVVKFHEVDKSFGLDLLQELARAYTASSNTRTQDCCAFAIQEVLRVCNNTAMSSDGVDVWSALPADCQEVLQSHLSTNYSASIPAPSVSSLPVFKSLKTKKFAEWICKWCTFLIHKLEDTLPKRIFLPCTLIFQHDTAPVVYLLPYVLMSALSQINPDLTKQICSEVMAVINHVAHSKDILPEDMHSTAMCAQTIFSALDFLTAWIIDIKKTAVVRKSKGILQKGSDEHTDRVKTFVDGIPKDTLGLAAFKCQAYTRSLMYLEMFLSGSHPVLEEHLGFLQKVYVALDEPDGVAGVAAIRNADPSLQEEIMECESTGNYRRAGALYEQIIQQDPDGFSHHEGLLRCLMRQGKITSAVMHVDGLKDKKPHWIQHLNAFRVEAAWKLGQWGDLEQCLKAESASSKNWDVNMGRLLLAAKQKDLPRFKQRLSRTQTEQMAPLSTASLEQGSYQRGYEYIVRLHMLQELEEYMTTRMSNKKQHLPQHSFDSWKARFALTQESFRTQEPILSLRRVILGLEGSKYCPEIAQYWLMSTKIARSAGYIQTSESFLLKAREFSLTEFNIEKAKHMRSEGDTHAALLNLQKFVRKRWPANICSEEKEESSIHAQALLLIGKWMEHTAHYDTQTVLKQYKSVISVEPNSEDGHFYLGKYYDRLMGFMARDRLAKSAEFLQFIIRHYGHALEYGCKYLYQCMPRLLTLWLDFGCKVPDSVSTGKKGQEKSGLKTVQQLNEIIQTMMEHLPPYQYLIAFPQLISRICHPNSDVFAKLEAIIMRLLQHYPQQCLWMMIAVNKSTHHDRRERCRRILDKAKKQLPGMGKLIDDAVKLTDKLLDVCNKPAEPSKNYTMDKICHSLMRLTTNPEFSCIMVPLQSSLTVTLPAGAGSSGNHNAFPGFQPTIERFEDKVEVLASLQKPKKISVCASDGKSYALLCKPKDDLRKDARLMEFNSVINKCLRKHPDCRQRRLHIRTYAVIPLNEECGILEWVPNTHGLRNILLKLYQEKGTYMSGRELRDVVKPAGRDPMKLKDVFIKQLLPKHPAIFGEWFLRTFPDPTAWYSCRLSYAHTSAVVSMVGYVLGLGDRHGENILFDSTNGDCVHVDFNCLFNRGETFEVAEVVPFRLTHNMVHALGATGCDGVFRKSCEITMKLMRTQCDTLLCVLKTFIHDPLVEWEKVKGRQSSTETTNEKAVKIVRDIEDRLQGNYPKSKGLPLSIEGQVDDLIKES